nr:uncharacterized protein LOC127339167 [Lolium perenne]
MVLATHQLSRELLDKGKGALARMHSMIFPKAKQEKTLGQLIDAFAVDTKEVIEVFKRTSRTYGALLAFQLMMGYGFKADIEEMTKELPKEKDGRLVNLSAFTASARTCARQLLDLVSSGKASAGPALSTQTQVFPVSSFVDDSSGVLPEGLLSIANATGDLETLYPKVLLPANIVVDILEEDSRVPEERGTPQG